VKLLSDSDSAVRYWAALGLFMRGGETVNSAKIELKSALGDASPYVRIVAAQALAKYGDEADAKMALPALVAMADWRRNDVFTVMAAVIALEAVGKKSAAVSDAIRALPAQGESPHDRYASYVPRLLTSLNAGLGLPPPNAALPKAKKKKGS
jgi:HEAT repeat protein